MSLEMKRSNNPPWSRDELIIVLYLYQQFRGSRSTADEKTKQEYSKILVNLARINGIKVEKFSNFRSPSSIGLRISNFFNLDKHQERGMSQHSEHARKIWKEFSYNYEKLEKEAKSIILFSENYKKSIEKKTNEDYIREGGIRLMFHKERERNKKIVSDKKKKILKEKGLLSCEICGFNFFEFYGAYGENFIECHHNKPLSEMTPNDKTFLSDLSLVCANCHRMIHRKRDCLSATELIKIVRENKKS